MGESDLRTPAVSRGSTSRAKKTGQPAPKWGCPEIHVVRKRTTRREERELSEAPVKRLESTSCEKRTTRREEREFSETLQANASKVHVSPRSETWKSTPCEKRTTRREERELSEAPPGTSKSTPCEERTTRREEREFSETRVRRLRNPRRALKRDAERRELVTHPPQH